MNSRHVLIITSEFPPNVGGIGNHAYNLANSLTSIGYIVTVVADTIGKTDAELDTFSKNCLFNIVWVKRVQPLVAVYLMRIVASIRIAGKADKVICSGKFSLWQAILVKWFRPGKELIAVVHGSELDLKSKLPKTITNYSLTKFQKIITVSDYTNQFLPVLKKTIQKRVIANGIQISEFADVQKVLLLGSPALITVGSLSERKGQQNVIAAMPEIKAIFPYVKYHCYGKPVMQKQLEAQAKVLGVQQDVFFYGEATRQKLLQGLNGATIKLMLSNHTTSGDFEGFGIAVLEANALGIPVIGSKNSGIADAIDDGKTGILVNPQNPAEIVQAITTILSNYSQFSGNAKNWAIQHDWKIIVKEYDCILQA